MNPTNPSSVDATPEQVAMSERIADKMYPRTHPGWIGGQACALAAIMETTEAAALDADLMRTTYGSPTGEAYDCGLWDQGVRIAGRFRNGKFLKGAHP